MEKNLGHATAYGYAKSKGYSGTEEEFAELMADYASVGQSAAQSAEQAAALAESASGSAATASQAAQTATSKASEAVTAADTATTKASKASTSANTASAAATSASTSAQTATTAASTATTKASEAAVSANTATTAKTDAETARDAAAQSASEAAASAESIDPDEFDRKIYAAFATDTATGAIASFPDGADSIPMKDVIVHIEPVQAGSGDPSPDNVRAISGWTAAKVMRTGKNLFDGNGIISVENNWRAKYDTGFLLKRGVTYTATVFSETAPTISYFNKEASVYTTLAQAAGRTVTYTPTEDVYAWIDFYWTSGNGKPSTEPDVQLELGSTATDYEPYSGQTYDITFPSEAGTVYGGTLDVTTGELVVDRAMVDLGTLSWSMISVAQGTMFRTQLENQIKKVPTMSDTIRAICNTYKSVPQVSRAEYTLSTGMNSENVDIIDSSYSSVGEFKDAMSGVQLCYELATPITYQLTPQEITSLLGENNVWADTGDSEVEYRADTKLYITKKITEAVSALS